MWDGRGFRKSSSTISCTAMSKHLNPLHEVLSNLFFKSSTKGEPKIPPVPFSSSISHHVVKEFPSYPRWVSLPFSHLQQTLKNSYKQLLRTVTLASFVLWFFIFLLQTQFFPAFPLLHCFLNTSSFLFPCSGFSTVYIHLQRLMPKNEIRYSNRSQTQCCMRRKTSPPQSCPQNYRTLQNECALLLWQHFIDSKFVMHDNSQDLFCHIVTQADILHSVFVHLISPS